MMMMLSAKDKDEDEDEDLVQVRHEYTTIRNKDYARNWTGRRLDGEEETFSEIPLRISI